MTPVDHRFTPVETGDSENLSPRRCPGLNKRGNPCRSIPPRNAETCIFHDPETDLSELGRIAGHASALARIKANSSLTLLGTVVSFTDRASIQAAIDVATRLYLGERIDREKFDSIIRACSVATRNFDKTGDTLEGPKPQAHEWNNYFLKVKAFLTTIDPVLIEATEQAPSQLPLPRTGEGRGEGPR